MPRAAPGTRAIQHHAAVAPSADHGPGVLDTSAHATRTVGGGHGAVVEPRGGGGHPSRTSAAPGGRLLQRKVGFEFESGDWHAWKYEGKLKPPGRDEPNNSLPGLLRPVRRQTEVMHFGTGFQLQGDDTEGPTKSSIEFVTSPLDTESHQGLDDLARALLLMDAIVKRIEPYKDRNEDKSKRVSDRYVFPEEHRLNAPGFYLSWAGDGAETAFKMQATAGIRLADLPKVMKYFGNVQGESQQKATERAPSRSIMQPDRGHAESLGSAKRWAEGACTRIEVAHRGAQQQHAPNPFANRRADLVGFLAAVMVFIRNVAQVRAEEIKYSFQLFGRSDFASLFGTLAAGQQAVFARNPGLLVDAVIAELNASAGMQLTRNSLVAPNASATMPSPQAVIDAGGAMNIHIPLFREMTIWRWLGVIALGGADPMTPQNIEAYLRSMARHSGEATNDDAFRTKVARHKAYLESVAAYSPDASSGGDALMLFENRGIINPFRRATNVKLDEAGRIAMAYLGFFVAVEQGRFGQFPQL